MDYQLMLRKTEKSIFGFDTQERITLIGLILSNRKSAIALTPHVNFLLVYNGHFFQAIVLCPRAMNS